MKYNDNGTYKDIYVKAFDTLPVGAIVEFDGATIPSGWEDIGNNKIKKTSQYIEGGATLPNYSLEEINTGSTWIDGKPIYRKVFTGSYVNARYFTIANITSLNIDNVIKIEGTFKSDRIGAIVPVAFTNTNVTAIQNVNFYIGYTNNEMTLNILQDTLSSGQSGSEYTGLYNCTIEYTKTTD